MLGSKSVFKLLFLHRKYLQDARIMTTVGMLLDVEIEAPIEACGSSLASGMPHELATAASSGQVPANFLADLLRRQVDPQRAAGPTITELPDDYDVHSGPTITELPDDYEEPADEKPAGGKKRRRKRGKKVGAGMAQQQQQQPNSGGKQGGACGNATTQQELRKESAEKPKSLGTPGQGGKGQHQKGDIKVPNDEEGTPKSPEPKEKTKDIVKEKDKPEVAETEGKPRVMKREQKLPDEKARVPDPKVDLLCARPDLNPLIESGMNRTFGELCDTGKFLFEKLSIFPPLEFAWSDLPSLTAHLRLKFV